MNYIVFDMEWNQPAPWKKLKYVNDMCLHNEIIQIGAVKLDASCKIVDTFTINIKPAAYEEINKNVRKLTGINEETLKDAPCIETAIETFKEWCGEDYIFIAWGYDDINVLGDNLKYFGLDTSWLPGCYNLQMIFCAQTDNENRQYSLSYAAEYFKITLDKPLHNALTDAYYTAEICGKLDIEKGIKTYRAMVFKDKSIPEHMKNILYKKN
jgi:DNA polymerase III alpha subunit (gram-positive type)